MVSSGKGGPGTFAERAAAFRGAVQALHHRFLLRHPKLVLSVLGLITLLALAGLTRFRMDVSSRPFFPDGDPATEAFETFRQTFRTDEALFLAVDFPGTVFARSPLEHLKGLAASLATLPGTTSSWSIANVDTLAEHLVDSGNWEGLRRYTLENPRYRGSLVAADGGSALLVVSVAGTGLAPEATSRIVEEIRRITREEACAGCTYHLSGLPVIQVDFNELVLRDQRVFGALAVILLTLFMLRLFRTVWGVVIPMLCGGLSVIWTLGLFFATGHRLTLVSSILSLVIMVISVANTIHMINYFVQRYRRTSNREGALGVALEASLPPCFLSTATTVVGFLSLGTSRIPAVDEFAVFASLGIFFSFLLTGFLVPVLLFRWVTPQSANKVPLDRGTVQRILATILRLIARRRLPLVMASVGFFVILSIGIVKIRSTMDVMSIFPEDSAAARAASFLQENYLGAHMLEILITAESEDVLTVDAMKRIEALDAYVNCQPEVNRTLSALLFMRPYLENLLSAQGKLKDVIESNVSLRSALAAMRPSQRELLQVFVDPDARTLRISAFLNTADSHTVTELARRIVRQGETILGPGMRATCTGELLLFSHVSTRLVSNLLTSLLQAFVVIFLAIGLILRSLKAVLVSLLPNVLPLAGLFGIMGWLGIPLTVPTSMVACIVLGLAVDDTIHFLHTYQERRDEGFTPDPAAYSALVTVGRAMIFTSSILVVGFFLGTLSQFSLIAQFGFLAGLSMLLALWNDLTLLPVCLLAWERVGKRHGGHALAALALVGVLLGGGTRTEAADAPEPSSPATHETLHVGTLAPAGTSWAEAAREASRRVRERSGGTLEIRWRFGASVGDESTMVARMREEALDGAILSMVGLTQISPAVTLLGLPFLFEDVGEARRVARAILPELQDRFRSEGFVLLGVFSLGFGKFFLLEPVQGLEELTALRVWTWKGDETSESALQALGFQRLVPLEMTDVLPALRYGLLDAFSGTCYTVTVLQWFPHAKYMVPLQWGYAFGGLVVTGGSLGRLAAGQREALRSVTEALADSLTDDSLRREREAEEGLEESQGMKRIDLPSADVRVLRERARAFRAKQASRIGEEGLLERILRETTGPETSGAEAEKGSR